MRAQMGSLRLVISMTKTESTSAWRTKKDLPLATYTSKNEWLKKALQ